MSVQGDLRRARQAMQVAPVQGALVCMGILGRFPQNPDARRLLGAMDAGQIGQVLCETDALCAAGHWEEAQHLLAPLGQAHPGDPALTQAEARCLFNLGRFKDLVERLRAPLAAHPDHPALLAAKGTALYRLGKAETALPLLMRARAALPNDPHVANHLGLVEKALGKLDAARLSFRAAAEFGLVEAWPNLAQLIDFRAAPELTAALDAALSAAPVPAQEELLAFTRAKAAFDLGDADAAFHWLGRGNRMHRDGHPYDAAGDRQRVLGLAARLPADAVTAPRGEPRIVLVVGMPRSGTTLVERILDAHPRVEGLGECPELAAMVAQIDRGQNWSSDDLAALGTAYRGALAKRRRGSSEVVVDKMPSNALVAGFALAALPDLAVVHVRREPVATCLSVLRTRFTVSNEFAYNVADVADRFALTDEVMELWRDRFPGRVHQVALDALTAQPGNEIARLLSLLDLPHAPACLDFRGATGDVRTASAHQVRGPVARQPTTDWQQFRTHLAPLLDALRRFGVAV